MRRKGDDTFSGKLRAVIVSEFNDRFEKCIMKISTPKT